MFQRSLSCLHEQCRLALVERSRGCSIKFRVVTENALLIERNPSCRLQVGIYMRPGGGTVVQGGDARKARFKPRHCPREGIAQPGHELKQRQVAIAHPASDEMAVALRVAFEHAVEVA